MIELYNLIDLDNLEWRVRNFLKRGFRWSVVKEKTINAYLFFDSHHKALEREFMALGFEIEECPFEHRGKYLEKMEKLLSHFPLRQKWKPTFDKYYKPIYSPARLC